MSTTSAPATMSAAAQETIHCTHCGLPVPEGLIVGERQQAQFCCNGCRAVYQIMSENGLEGFYGLRDRTGGAPRGVAVEEGDLVGAEAYAHYDDPTFLDDHARADGEQRTIDLYADGVHCAACVWVMERLPQVMPGVAEASLSLADQRLRIRWDPEAVSLGKIGGFLHRLGYATHPLGEAADAARRAARRGALIRLAVAFALAGNTMLLAAAMYAGGDTIEAPMARFFEWLSLGLAIPAVTYGAWPFYQGALSGLRVGRPHMDLPVSLGLLAGFFASAYATVTDSGHVYFDSVTVLVFLLLLGRYLQSRGQQAAMTGTELMTALTPGTAWRLTEGEGGARSFVAAPVNALVPGDRVRVRAGEICPVDGRVAEGQTHVDASLLTGESRPVPAMPGAPVYAGTVNVDDEIVIEVESSGASTRLGRLAALVDQADPHRAPVVRLADRIAGLFVSVVLGLAVAGGVTWAFIDPDRIFDVVVSLLVVSCPCALGLATPVALAVARGRAARAGILIRSTTALERLVHIERVVLDKTGTLTEGQLAVADVCWAPGADAAREGAHIEALERRSSHPAARAVARWALGQMAEGAVPLPVAEVQEQPGKGIQGVVAGRRLVIGRLGWADVREGAAVALPSAMQAAADAALSRGDSVVLAVADGAPVAALIMRDQIRQDTPAALDRMRAMGLSLAVESGDHPQVVAEIASRLGIGEAVGGASPEDKAAAVTGASALTAMVGDGINDAPALRQAEVGIAIAGGAEAALQVADVYLTRPGLATVADVFEGARRTFKIIRRNLAFSLVYNVLFATLALTGHITPLAAAILMPISSLTVVASSVFSRTWRPSAQTHTGSQAPS